MKERNFACVKQALGKSAVSGSMRFESCEASFRKMIIMNRTWKATIIVILALLLSTVFARSGTVLAAIARDDMPTLNMKKLAEFDRPSGAGFLEGGTVTSSEYLMTFMNGTGNSQTSQNPVYALNVSTWKQTRSGSAALSHANDMCYVPKRREIYVTPMDEDNPRIIVLDESKLSVKKVISMPVNYHAIGYDSEQDCFAAVCASGKGTARALTCHILNSTLGQVMKSFPIHSNLTYQGLSVHDSKVYYSCWERGSTSTYEPVYDGVLKKNDNVIYVYDYSGNMQNAYLITPPDGFSKFEIETVSFLGNRMILQFNEVVSDSKANRLAIYEVTGENPSANQIAKEKAQKKAAQEQELNKIWSGLARMKPAFSYVKKYKGAIKLKWKKLKVSSQKVTGYEVQVCRSKSFKGSTLQTMKTTRIKCKIKGLARKKKYYVRVRAYKTIDGRTWYSKWSKKVRVRTK